MTNARDKALARLRVLRNQAVSPPLADEAKASSWYKVRAQAANAAEIYIYGQIGDSWFDDDAVSAADFVAELKDLDVDQIDLFVNSPGGDVFDGLAIYNALRRHRAAVNVTVDGLAASAASFIAMAGDTVTVARNAMVMIHDAWGFAIGNAAEMREMSDLLDKHSDNIADIYAQRAGGDKADWREAMRAESWYTGLEAVDAGLADDLAEGADTSDAPANKFDLSVFSYAGRDEAPEPPKPAARVSDSKEEKDEAPVPMEDSAAKAADDTQDTGSQSLETPPVTVEGVILRDKVLQRDPAIQQQAEQLA